MKHYEILKTADPSFFLFRFNCHKCGNRIGSATAQFTRGGVPVKAEIEYEGEVAHIARESGIQVEYMKGEIWFSAPTHTCTLGAKTDGR